MTVIASRRTFLAGAGAAGAGLVIGVTLPGRANAQDPAPKDEPVDPNTFIRITPDDSVTVIVKHVEFGQGPNTGLATLVAEELDADWAQMRAESAPANTRLFANLLIGSQLTGGSSAIANSYLQMRKAGATARALLVQAAATQWGVPVREISVAKGVVRHAKSGRTSGFGALATAASKLAAPAEVRLKDPAQFTLIGTDLPKLDSVAKSNGSALFTIDVRRPGMVHSAILHPPKFGATAKAVDSSEAENVSGVLGVRTLPQGVVVYAKSTYAALKGRSLLGVEWDDSKAETRSSALMTARYAKAAQAPGVQVELRGDPAPLLGHAAKTLDAEYHFPFLAHAPMETLDAVVELAEGGGAEVWMGCQDQTTDQATMAKVLGVDVDRVKINTMFAGGSFGRRCTADGDFAAEAAAIAKAWPKAPVKHIWTRENDIKGGFYRPLAVHRMRGGIDGKGNIVAWDHVIAIQSFVAGTQLADVMIRNGVDEGAVEGATKLPYAIPNLRVGQHLMEYGIPTLWWRSVGHTHTGYSTETFLDELLAMGGRDPVAGRLALLTGDDAPRHTGVLRRVAEIADWSGPKMPRGRFRGVALHKSFGTYVAQIAEVSRKADGTPRVHKVWCAIDCGVAVNPDVIRAQMEGGIGYALGHALHNEIVIEDGGMVRQSNFDDYRSLGIAEMPEIEVAIIRSGADPTGVGEPGVPPLAPAVANAWRLATGTPMRSLPMIRGDVA